MGNVLAMVLDMSALSSLSLGVSTQGMTGQISQTSERSVRGLLPRSGLLMSFLEVIFKS